MPDGCNTRHPLLIIIMDASVPSPSDPACMAPTSHTVSVALWIIHAHVNHPVLSPPPLPPPFYAAPFRLSPPPGGTTRLREAAVLQLLVSEPADAGGQLVGVDVDERLRLREGLDDERRQPHAARRVALSERAVRPVGVLVVQLPLVACGGTTASDAASTRRHCSADRPKRTTSSPSYVYSG